MVTMMMMLMIIMMMVAMMIMSIMITIMMMIPGKMNITGHLYNFYHQDALTSISRYYGRLGYFHWQL